MRVICNKVDDKLSLCSLYRSALNRSCFFSSEASLLCPVPVSPENRGKEHDEKVNDHRNFAKNGPRCSKSGTEGPQKAALTQQRQEEYRAPGDKLNKGTRTHMATSQIV